LRITDSCVVCPIEEFCDIDVILVEVEFIHPQMIDPFIPFNDCTVQLACV